MVIGSNKIAVLIYLYKCVQKHSIYPRGLVHLPNSTVSLYASPGAEAQIFTCL